MPALPSHKNGSVKRTFYQAQPPNYTRKSWVCPKGLDGQRVLWRSHVCVRVRRQQMKCNFKSPEQNPDRHFRGSMSVCLFFSPVSVTYCCFLVTELAKIATHAHTSTKTQTCETLSQWTGFPFVRTPLILNGFFFFLPPHRSAWTC